MKKITTFLKLGFIALSLAIVVGIVPTQQKVSAFGDEEMGCPDTACINKGWIFEDCQCNTTGCGGCYKQNGASGCGVCTKGPNEIDPIDGGGIF